MKSKNKNKNKAGKQKPECAEEMMSPAQRYAQFRSRQSYSKSLAGRFESGLPFEIDDFQRKAINALENGQNVLVAAPTGAGKTVIADFAVFLAQHNNVKAFYTTPIKALSNQKYNEFAEKYGSDRVGLLTGDLSVNSDADIVVMTTEVLRNMLYEKSTSLETLHYVILDEVHYLADKFRGAVWEEVIIHLPLRVKIIGLSATVSNVEDFSGWIKSVRGDTALVVTEKRPVPLVQHVMTQADERTEPELFDLYRSENSSQVNPELLREISRLEARAKKSAKHERGDSYSRRHKGGMKKSSKPRASRLPGQDARYEPKRWAIVDELDYLDMLPGIYFIFSRNGCDRAVDQCLRAGLCLTSQKEADEIRKITDSMLSGNLSPEDAYALNANKFRFALERGFAAHHAAMIALFRQIVEKLFEKGLIKCVFATETLALGINMPARSVIVEKTDKFNGEGHVPLTAGEFTQLTGRAGRRGTDSTGHSIIVDHRGFVPANAAALSSKRVYPLHSCFKPTFNMAVNLLSSNDYFTARNTLDRSFAQWEADESAQNLSSLIASKQRTADDYAQAFACDKGNFEEFMLLRMELSELEKAERRKLKSQIFSSDEEKKAAWKALDKKITETRQKEQTHPCRSCPDLQDHLRWGHRWTKTIRELQKLKKRYDVETTSISKRFDNICKVLTELGYIEKDASVPLRDKYLLTDKGQLLRRLYSEQDIVVAQCLTQGCLDNLDPQSLAAVCSGFIYEARRGSTGFHAHFPGGLKGAIYNAVQDVRKTSAQVHILCEGYAADDIPNPDFSVVDVIFDWTSGKDLYEIIENSDFTGGDFVRTCKRLADLLGQIADGANYVGADKVAQAAIQALKLIDRGIVAYSGIEK